MRPSGHDDFVVRENQLKSRLEQVDSAMTRASPSMSRFTARILLAGEGRGG
jgi:hypothetical protein